MGFLNETPIVIVGLGFPAQSAPAIGVFEHNRDRRPLGHQGLGSDGRIPQRGWLPVLKEKVDHTQKAGGRPT